MGGSGWSGTGPYREDLKAAFREAQELELAQDDHGFTGYTIDELWRNRDWQEYIVTGGTGSTLDFVTFVVGRGPEGDAGRRMRMLTEAEVLEWAPDGRPTRAQWKAAVDSGVLHDVLDRACGNCTVLYADGEPAEIAYWGITAD